MYVIATIKVKLIMMLLYTLFSLNHYQEYYFHIGNIFSTKYTRIKFPQCECEHVHMSV